MKPGCSKHRQTILFFNLLNRRTWLRRPQSDRSHLWWGMNQNCRGRWLLRSLLVNLRDGWRACNMKTIGKLLRVRNRFSRVWMLGNDSLKVKEMNSDRECMTLLFPRLRKNYPEPRRQLQSGWGQGSKLIATFKISRTLTLSSLVHTRTSYLQRKALSYMNSNNLWGPRNTWRDRC